MQYITSHLQVVSGNTQGSDYNVFGVAFTYQSRYVVQVYVFVGHVVSVLSSVFIVGERVEFFCWKENDCL